MAKRKAVRADEIDVVHARRFLVWRRGEVREVKRRMRRRVRREDRRELHTRAAHRTQDGPLMDVTAEHLHESNLIENINDPTADATSAVAWAYLADQPELTLEVVLETHRLVTVDTPHAGPGRLRTVDVRVGLSVKPPWETVSGMLADWLRDMAGWRELDPRHQHVAFENIHPFRDGNGRTGRLLLWWHQLRLGQEPILLRAAEREAYYRWFATEADVDYWLDRAHNAFRRNSGRRP
jgi:Fic family protein